MNIFGTSLSMFRFHANKSFCPKFFFPALNSILDDTEKWFSTKTFFQYIATAVIKIIRPENCTLNTFTERYRCLIHFDATLNFEKIAFIDSLCSRLLAESWKC